MKQAIGAAQDAARMQRIVSFYQKLPRGQVPKEKASGIFDWYRLKYFGQNSSAMREFYVYWNSVALHGAGQLRGEYWWCMVDTGIANVTLPSGSYLACVRLPHALRICSELLLPPTYVGPRGTSTA